MSAFALPIPPTALARDLRRLTERSATAQMPVASGQWPEEANRDLPHTATGH